MRAFALTLALVIAAAASGQAPVPRAPQTPAQTDAPSGFIFWNTSRHSVDFMLESVPQADPERLALLKQSFFDLQCRGANLHEQVTPGGGNLLCNMPAKATGTPQDAPSAHGATAVDPASQSGTILFLAHYEHEGQGRSAVDNWSGAVMLPFLYHALSATPRYHTYLFAAVDGEAGAKALFDSFTPAQRNDLKGVVALDALGLGPAQFYISSNDVDSNAGVANFGWFWLQHQLMEAAIDQRLDTPLAAIPGSWLKTDVTREFRHHDIASIVIHSVTLSTRGIPGSVRDTPSAINHDIYFNTFVLLAYYAVELDKPWPFPRSRASSSPSGGRRR